VPRKKKAGKKEGRCLLEKEGLSIAMAWTEFHREESDQQRTGHLLRGKGGKKGISK